MTIRFAAGALGLTSALTFTLLGPGFGANVPTALDRAPALLGSSPMALGQDETPRAPPIAQEPSGNPLWGVPLSSLAATRERPVFLPSRRQPRPAVAAPPPVIAPRVAAPPAEPERPDLSLVGTVAGETSGIGVFIDNSTRDVVRIKTGEGHTGWILRSVAGREVTFDNGRRSVTLALPASGTAPGTIGAIPAPAAAQAAGNTWVDGDGQLIAPPKKSP